MARRENKGITWHIAGGVFVAEAVVTPGGLIIEGPLNTRKENNRHGDVTLRLLIDLSGVAHRSLSPKQLTALWRHLRASVKAAREAIDTN